MRPRFRDMLLDGFLVCLGTILIVKGAEWVFLS
jgi:hypothetical protein